MMMKASYIFAIFLLLSCNSQEKDENQIPEETEAVTITHTLSQMQLVGKAQTIALHWVAYQEFLTSLENLDHTAASCELLIAHLNEMKTSIPEEFKEQGVLSRFKVLETRVKSYHSLLTHTQIDSDKQQKRFDQLILALDQFKIQLMDKFIADQQIDNLLKNLEENELHLDQPDSTTVQ